MAAGFRVPVFEDVTGDALARALMAAGISNARCLALLDTDLMRYQLA
jgi:hypothetical protein